MKVFTIAKNKKLWIIIGWIIVWHIIYVIVNKPILIPSPFNTIKALIEMTKQKQFYLDAGFTVIRVVTGVAVSMGIGSSTALVSYFFPLFKDILHPMVKLIQSTPVMAIIIVALVWFPSIYVPIFVCFLMCYPIAYNHTLTGLYSVDKDLLEMSKIYAVKKRYIITDIYLPHLRGATISILHLSMGMAWKVVIAAEVLAAAKKSIGYNMLNAKVYLETEQLFAWIIIIVFLSSVGESISIHLMEKRGSTKW